MALASSVTRSGIQTFARYRNVKAGFSQSTVTGGILYADSTYFYRVFITSGTLNVSGSPLVADILVIAGGGGGGQGKSGTWEAGGGGAGGLQAFASQTLAATSFTVTVGAGGASTTNGSNSQFGALTSSVGGGNGAGGTSAAVPGNGGSGGGNWYTTPVGTGTSGQGNNGGIGNASSSAGGGGGAGAVGANSIPSYGGAGGAGSNLYSTWAAATSTGVNGYYAGGGGGSNTGAGGAGGGGVGGVSVTAGAVNTGSGGGGGVSTANTLGGAGGSGIVIVRYSKSSALSSTIWQADSAASSLKIATPFSSSLSYNDYSATILGTGTNRVLTPVNSPVFQTTVSKYYGSSLNMGAYTDNKYISTPTNANLQIGTNDFTIEGWYYFTSTSVSGGYQCLASHAGDSGDQQPGWLLLLEANTALSFYACTAGGSGWSLALVSSTTPTANAWHHISVTRASGVVRMFLNGTQIGTVTSSNNIGIPASQTFRIGSYQYFPGPVAKGLSGYIQDFRFYIGTAKYTTTFTPPAQIYTGG